ncbi:sigma-54-dependent transcriptional regulator [Croceimicrobium sp.]|uniref:sigma-54-dependent transcriptional regulator n=1 Tax=Croceimicrobium sp. TaxID=2828340 RepID=UPI003BAA07BC
MKSAARILIIDDDADLRESLALYLKIHFNKVSVLGDPRKVHQALNEDEYDLILLDMNFQAGRNDGQEGLYWLKHIRELRPEIMVLLITAYGDIDLAIEALKSGASDFILKPWQNQKLLAALLRAYELKSTKGKLKQFQEQQGKSGNELIQLLEDSARSASSIALLQQARRVAETDAQVLIRGENGTGKSQLARYLHLNSLRKDEPFVSVDLGAIPENLFEAELFGVKKGAFTDAREDRSGLVQQAEGGTLFLDEIGNCSLLHQQKLLRLIQDQSYQTVGSPELRHCNVRIIAASNSDLEKAVSNGLFREDLYYRINTIELRIEALRNRKEDLEVLIDHYLEQHNRKYGRQLVLAPEHRAQLMAYHWPGNIRELSHSLERAVILKEGQFDLDTSSRSGPNNSVRVEESLSLNLEELEARHIHQVLAYYQGNISKTAQHLGVNRNTLYRKLDKYRIQHEV